jgi:hypothetical protein
MEPLKADDPCQAGEFRLRARLGAGGMGRVYLGMSPAGRAVAVKIVHPGLARDDEFLGRFRSEVAAAQAVNGLIAPLPRSAHVLAGIANRWMGRIILAGRGTLRHPRLP